MKKALIITYYDSDNYGAFLQAFSTQIFLNTYGVEANVLDYTSYSSKLLGGLYRIIKGKTKITDSTDLEYHNKMAHQVREAQHLIKKTKIKKGYDVTILGSDEIWNVKNLGAAHDPMLFCRNKGSKRTISYAACAGNSSKKHLKLFPYAISGIKQLDAVSVRDDGTEKLVKGIGRNDAFRVLDPTFLVDFSTYLPGALINEDYIFVYSYGLNKEQIREIVDLAQSNDLKIVATGCCCEWADYNPAPTPFEWVRYIKDAKFVVTSTFHGTVLSIQNRTPFAVFNASSPKIKSVLRELCLLDRRVTEWNSLKKMYNNGLQYDKIENLLEKKITVSKSFLLEQFDIVFQNDKNTYNAELNKTCYIARHKDANIRWASRSGGAFTAISDVILFQGGVVYGATLNEDFSVSHIRATSREERNRMRGSKYVQSNMSESIHLVKKDLSEGKLVLFTGTPCQTDAIRKAAEFIKKNQNLITVDFICHGVPSPRIWKDYLNLYKDVSAVDFRNKKLFGWGDHIETVVSNGKMIASKKYTTLYYNDLIDRPSCHECPYATFNRCSDITIADCWGLESLAPGFNDDDSGASMIFASSEKGEEVLCKALESMTSIKNNLYSMKQPVLESQGMGTVMPNPNRKQFWNDYHEFGIEYVCNRYANQRRLQKIITAFRPPHSVRFFIKKLLRRN